MHIFLNWNPWSVYVKCQTVATTKICCFSLITFKICWGRGWFINNRQNLTTSLEFRLSPFKSIQVRFLCPTSWVIENFLFSIKIVKSCFDSNIKPERMKSNCYICACMGHSCSLGWKICYRKYMSGGKIIWCHKISMLVSWWTFSRWQSGMNLINFL